MYICPSVNETSQRDFKIQNLDLIFQSLITMASTGRMPRTQHFGIFKVMLHTWTQMNNYFEKESYRTQDSYGKEEGYEWSLCMQSDRHTRPEGHQGWESLLTKKSETWIQIQRYVEMLAFLLFGNPWGYRFQGAFGNSIQSTREVDQWAGFLICGNKYCLFFFTRPT